MVKRGEIGDGLALDHGAGALYINEELKECVSSRPAARAMRIGGENVPIPVRYLGMG